MSLEEDYFRLGISPEDIKKAIDRLNKKYGADSMDEQGNVKPEQKDHWLGAEGMELHKAMGIYLTGQWVSKNSDYGDSFAQSLDKYGLLAASVRMSDKLNRFDNLTKPKGSTKVYGDGTLVWEEEAQVNDESIEDTLLDLANYAIMTAMYLVEKSR